MDLLRRLSRFLIFTNLLIALAAVAQCYLTYIILREAANMYILLIEGGSTLLLYNFSLYLSKPLRPGSSPYLRTRWVFGHMHWFWLWSTIAFLVLIYAVLRVHPYTLVFLTLVGAISISYSLPIFSVKGKRIGLRQVPGVKLFYIALVWSLSSVGLPVVELWAEGTGVDWWVANYLGVLKVLFLLICTLPFDIRDMERDSYYHLRTIPNIIGARRAQGVCYGMLVLHTALLWLAPYDFAVKLGLSLTNVSVLAVLYFLVFRNIQKYNQVYLLDFALVWQCVLTYIIAV